MNTISGFIKAEPARAQDIFRASWRYDLSGLIPRRVWDFFDDLEGPRWGRVICAGSHIVCFEYCIARLKKQDVL